MAGNKSRREPRIDLDRSVTLLLPDGEAEYPVGDASYRGVFLITDDPLPLRKLVRFRTQLRPDQEPLQMMGVVAHHISPADGDDRERNPGMGIHLFSVGEQTHRRWREFIRERYEANPDARKRVKRLECPHVVAHIQSHEDLTEFFDDEVTTGEMFVRSSEIHDEGSNIIVDVVHPDGDESIDLKGTVREAVESPPRKRGMTIDFEGLDDRDRHRIEAFARGDFETMGKAPMEKETSSDDGSDDNPESTNPPDLPTSNESAGAETST